jgi:hypothetical protein
MIYIERKRLIKVELDKQLKEKQGKKMMEKKEADTYDVF